MQQLQDEIICKRLYGTMAVSELKWSPTQSQQKQQNVTLLQCISDTNASRGCWHLILCSWHYIFIGQDCSRSYETFSECRRMEMSAVSYRPNGNIRISSFLYKQQTSCFTFRVKIFKGRKVHGEYDVKVEQVGRTWTFQFLCVTLHSPIPWGQISTNTKMFWSMDLFGLFNLCFYLWYQIVTFFGKIQFV